MADIVRTSQVVTEVIAATSGIAIRASQASLEIISQTPSSPVRTSQTVLEVISLRYVTHIDTVAMTASATATVSATTLHEFTGWGIPL